MTRTLFAQGWAWAGMLFLMFTGLACEQLSPGVSGRVLLGRSILVAQNAQQIVINLYKPEDFDTDKKLPKPGAQPLATKVLRSVNTPSYDYELEANFPNQKVYAFAFLDQDNSGGITPTHTDVYGTHQNNHHTTKHTR